MHLVVRVARGRVLHHRDLVAELSGIADSCFHTGVRNEPDHDELMDAVLLELQIEIVFAKPLEHQCSEATMSPG